MAVIGAKRIGVIISRLEIELLMELPRAICRLRRA